MKRSTKTAPGALSRPWGAHMSIAGGVSNSIDRAAQVGCRALQIFTKNSNQWRAAKLDPEQIERFRKKARELQIEPVAAHDSYLINLAAPERDLYEKSLAAFIDEVERAEALKIPYLVFHPGSRKKDDESTAIKRVIEAINATIDKTEGSEVTLTIETTAGQGATLGDTFESIARMIEGVENQDRVGVCLDTCHVFAAGYELRTRDGYEKTMSEFDKTIGFEKLKLFHLNDSKKEFRSRVDRHEHIGLGHIGADGFIHLLNDERFFDTPMILETPKGATGEEDMANLARLASYIGRGADPASAK